jgi:hypothetical protein
MIMFRGIARISKAAIAVLIVLALSSGLYISCAESPPEPVPVPQEPQETPPASPSQPAPSRPTPSERVPRITPEKLLEKIEQDQDILIIDARTDVQSSFVEGHIKGAVPVPPLEIFNGEWVPQSDMEMVLYCT